MQFLKEYLNKSVGCFPLKTPSKPNQGKLMSKHFIKDIEIKNFKCFEDFRAEGFGRVNLIGGKNNVGKSTLLEALYINLNGTSRNCFLNSIFKVIQKRDNFFVAHSAESTSKFLKTAFFYKSTISKEYKNHNQNNINTNLNQINFSFLEKFSGTTITCNINGEDYQENISFMDFKDLFNENKRFYTDNKIHFLRPIGLNNYLIDEYYENVQKSEKENDLDKELNLFDEQIKKFKIMSGEPKVLLNDEYISVTQLGDGAKKIINIFISIYSAKDGVILIDELDNGIHYSYLDKLWEIILIISKQQNIQVFATTHSKECIESYVRVAKRLEDNEIKFIEMFKYENEIQAMILDNKMLDFQLKQNHEVR
jgi:AAA15 family ATPase/GTPase